MLTARRVQLSGLNQVRRLCFSACTTAGISNLRVAGFTGYEVSHFMAVRADMPVLAALLRKGLAAVPAATRQRVEEEWLGLQVMPLWQIPGFQWAVGAPTTLLLLAALWVYSLRVQVASRTALLSSINRVLMHSLGVRSEQDALRHGLEEACALFRCQKGACGLLEADLWRPQVCCGQEDLPPLSVPSAALVMLSQGAAASWRMPRQAVVLMPLRGGDHGPLMVLGLFRGGVVARTFGKAERDMLSAWVVSVEEVLRRKRAEQQLKEKEMQLQRGQRMEALGALAGGIAHDFNNSLGSIVANAELLDMFHATDEDATRKIRSILAAAGRGRDVVRRILHFTRREEEGKSLLRLGPLACEVLDLLEASLPSGVGVSLRGQEDTALVRGSGTQLHQVVMNLCVNAVQAMQAVQRDSALSGASSAAHVTGQLEITVGQDTLDLYGDREVHVLEPERGPASPLWEIRLGKSTRGEPVPCAVICVRDSGPGMDDATMRRMFSPFFSTKAPGEGTGLGLAVVQSLVAAHQGCIVARSGVGRGTEFCICLPQARSEAQISPPISSSQDSCTCAARARILLADDDEDFCQAAAFLRSRGYAVSTAGGGRQGLAQVEAAPADFDLVLTDYRAISL